MGLSSFNLVFLPPLRLNLYIYLFLCKGSRMDVIFARIAAIVVTRCTVPDGVEGIDASMPITYGPMKRRTKTQHRHRQLSSVS
jgi:hypothetical protein